MTSGHTGVVIPFFAPFFGLKVVFEVTWGFQYPLFRPFMVHKSFRPDPGHVIIIGLLTKIGSRPLTGEELYLMRAANVRRKYNGGVS